MLNVIGARVRTRKPGGAEGCSLRSGKSERAAPAPTRDAPIFCEFPFAHAIPESVIPFAPKPDAKAHEGKA